MIIEIIIVAALIGLDQLVKYLTIVNIKGQASVPVIDGIFELSYVENTGAAFGILQNNTILLSIVVVVVVVGIIYYKSLLPKTAKYRILHYLALFIIAGALGNLFDRLIHGYVVDMFHFYWFEFPVFNVADIYVTCSAILLMILVLTKYRNIDEQLLARRKKQNPADDN